MRCGFLDKNGGSGVPLEKIHIRGCIKGFTAEVQATMEYKNCSDSPIEAIYVFPLDEEAAVCGFQAIIDGRTIVAEIQEKQEARDTYDDAISSGQSAFLLEESDESSDIFQINVGNLPPKLSATVQLTFVTTLTVEKEGRVVFVLPTVLNPRYTPSDSDPSVTTTTPSIASVSTKYAFDFELDVQCASPIQEITSPCNRLQVDINPQDNHQAIVRLDEDYEFKADVQVHVLCSKPFEPCVLIENGVMETSTKDEKKNEFLLNPVVMLNFFPLFESDASLEQSEFVFVVDRSGSMNGKNIQSAKDTLLLFLKSLPEGCFFNVIGFGSTFEKLFSKSESYNDKSLDHACAHAQSMEADLRGTEILSPLKDVFAQPLMKGHPRQVFLLTDGAVGNTQEVIDLIRSNATKARCFAVGIGAGASTALVKGVARAGKGMSEFVSSSDKLQAKVINLLKNALQPALTDCKVTWDLRNGCQAKHVPEILPPIFSGKSFIMYGVITNSQNTEESSIKGSVTLSATLTSDSKKENVSHTLSLEDLPLKSKQRSLLLHRLASKAWIQEKQDNNDGSDAVNEEIVQMSKSASIVSKLTSFIAVDKDTNKPISSALETHSLPSPKRFILWRSANSPGYALGTKKGLRLKKSRGISFGNPLSKLVSRKSRNTRVRMQPCSERSKASACQNRSQLKCGGFSDLAQDSSSISKTQKGCLSIVALQKASGAWELTDELANLCGVTVDKLKQACPSILTADNKDSQWATAIAISCLTGRFADQQDEWEMVAAKGTKWLKANISSKGLSYDQIMDFASGFLSRK